MTAKSPSVTIGVPTVNSQERISECIESLLAQTYGDFRLAISVNGSDDRTEEICRSFAAKDRRIEVHVQSPRKSMKANFEFLLERSDSDLFCWRADDDLSADNWLETMTGLLADDPTASVAVSDHERYEEGQLVAQDRNFDIPDDPVERARLMLLDESCSEWLGMIIYGLWRRDRLKSIVDKVWSVYDSEILHGSDYMLVIPVVLDMSLRFTPAKLFTRRILSERERKGHHGRMTRYEKYSSFHDLYIKAVRAGCLEVENTGYEAEVKRELRRIVEDYARDRVTLTGSWKFKVWGYLARRLGK